MQLFEGAKITQQILRQAINDPDFTFGIEAEFFLEGAIEFMQQHRNQGLERKQAMDGEYFVKKLGDMDWHDVTHFFKPFGVVPANTRPNFRIMQDRLEDTYEEETYKDAISGSPDVMWDYLKDHLGIHVLMAALRIYPNGRILGLPRSQERVFHDIVYDGDTNEIKPFGKLRDVEVAVAPADEEEFYSTYREESLTAFYNLVAKDLSRKLGTDVHYVSDDSLVYHVGGYKSWVVTSDTSLEDERDNARDRGQDLVGVEVISPIMSAQEGLAMMNQLLEIMNGEILGLKVVTTKDTGLHINLGVKNKEIDPMKILVLSGDEYMLNKFDRAASYYASSAQREMKDRMANVAVGKTPEGRPNFSSQDLIKQAQVVLNSIETDERDIDRVIAVLNDIKPEGKNHSINFEKLPSGYVEYRGIGNAGYEKRANDILNTVLHMIGMTYIATEPEAYRKEFLKKLYSMVQNSIASEQPIAASVGVIGYGPRGGYGAPIEDSEPTPYDGENFMTKFGFDSGSDTQ